MEKNELAQRVGATIAGRRKRLGLTQAELAERLEIGQESLSRMEQGIISPKFSRLPSLAAALGCSVPELFRAASGDAAGRASAIADLLRPLPPEGQEAIVAIVEEIVQVMQGRFRS